MVGAVMMNMEMKMAVHNNNHSNFESLSENHSMDIQSLSSSSSASESEPRNHLDQNIGCQTQDDYSDITTKSTTTRTIMNVNMNVGHHERSHDRSAKFVGKHSQTHSQSHNVNVPLTPLSIIPMNMNTDGEHDFKDDSCSGRRAAHEPITTNTTSRTSQDHEDDDESSRCSSSMYSHDQFGTADEGYGSVSSMHSCSHDFLGSEGRDMDGDTHMRTPYYEPRQQQQLRKPFTVTIPMDIDVGYDHEYENDTTIRKRKQDQLHHKQSSDLEEKKLRSGTPTHDTKLSTAEKPIVVRIPSNLALDCLGQDDASVDGDVSVTSVTEIDASSIVIVPVSPVPQSKKHPELSPIPFQLDQHGYDPRIYATPPQDLALSVRPAPSQTFRNELGLQLLKMDQRQVQPSSLLPPIELSFRPNLKTAASDDMNISQTLSEGDMNLESTATPLKLKQLSAKFSQITDNARSCALPYPHSPIPACRDLIRRTSESKQGQRVRAAISAQNDLMQHKIQLQRDRFEKYKAERAVRKALRMEKRRKLKEEKEKRRSRIIVIPSNHRLKLLWDTLTVLLTFVSAYVGHIYIRDRSTYEWDWFVLFTNTWFFIDVVLNFFTDHRTGDGKLLQNGREVWGRYLTTWFAIDALSLLPWERMFLRPIIQKQKRRNIVVKWFFRSKAVVKVTVSCVASFVSPITFTLVIQLLTIVVYSYSFLPTAHFERPSHQGIRQTCQ